MNPAGSLGCAGRIEGLNKKYPTSLCLFFFPPTSLKSLAIAYTIATFFALYEKKITAHFKIAYLLIKPSQPQRTMPERNTPDCNGKPTVGANHVFALMNEEDFSKEYFY